MEVFSSLGIDWKLLFAQLFNFLLLLGLLYKFLYNPVVKLLESREEKVRGSLNKALEIDARLQKLGEDENKVLKDAQIEAELIVSKGKGYALEESERMREKTREDITRLVTDAKSKIAGEKEEAFRELKGEIADLVILAGARAFGEDAVKKADKHLIEETIKML